MAQLINKGGFRERANRSRKYKQSENEITSLPPSQYQPHHKDEQPLTRPEPTQDHPPKNEA